MRPGLCEIAGRVMDAVLAAAEPAAAVDRVWPGELDSAGRVVLVAAGKGGVAMARAASARLGRRLARGVVVGPASVVGSWRDRPSAVDARGGDHPIPTARNAAAAGRVLQVASGCGPDETLLVLVSGGASAYLAMPCEGVTLNDIARVTGALLRAGATIREVNAVRKHCEVLKGGGLARAARGAGGVWSLVLSDVLGDPLDAVGSGPTAGDPTTFGEAVHVLERYGLLDVSPAVRARLEGGAAGGFEETAKPGDPVVERVRHVVVANNAVAVGAAAGAMRGLGHEIVETRTGVEGEAGDVGRGLAGRVSEAAHEREGRAVCVVWGGETTVRVGDASGAGGRAQEVALAAALSIEGLDGAGVLTLATDGVDGPTDAAGGIVGPETARAMRAAGVDPDDALARHDSHTALDRVGALVRTGQTGTNVNDVYLGFSRGFCGGSGGGAGVGYAGPTGGAS